MAQAEGELVILYLVGSAVAVDDQSRWPLELEDGTGRSVVARAGSRPPCRADWLVERGSKHSCPVVTSGRLRRRR
jgi:hypothetical protein